MGRDGSWAVSSQHTPPFLLAVCFMVTFTLDILFRLKQREREREREKKVSISKDVK